MKISNTLSVIICTVLLSTGLAGCGNAPTPGPHYGNMTRADKIKLIESSPMPQAMKERQLQAIDGNGPQKATR